MKNQFNFASLTGLSRTELLAMLANLQGQFNAASFDDDRALIRAKITKVSYALTFR